MKKIATNKLQKQLSEIIKEVEAGEVYEVHRYLKSVAYLVPRSEFEKLVSGSGCKDCMQDLRKIAKKINE
jgi:prevent-host-death family protein